VSATDAILGELAVALAALSYACGAVWARHRITGQPLVLDPATGPRPPTPVEIALPQVAFAAALTFVLSTLTDRPTGGVVPLPPDAVSWISVTWLGMLGSGFAYLLFFGIMRTWGATRTTLVTYALPVVGIALGVIVLDEALHPAEIVGTVLVLVGLAVSNARVGQRVVYGRRQQVPDTLDEMRYHLDPP
jgi:drug/metabolite transporter (DMT)-like permease